MIKWISYTNLKFKWAKND
ncbi:hypothetical protein Bhyg_08563 [Pseudolycoriella hygida]|uniref:Uncharacterized protein n=1 Tax=Pseudolycoriella hygida TaxID=35572 RepID=A0A9Q0S4X7_9DIPT|nr:hypothetical protein Bhyg_08563 [Pseudolycoriella hygida]